MAASWSCSLDPKWPNRPLLLRTGSLASRPIVSPSSPSVEATSTARATMGSRVAVAVGVTLGRLAHERSCVMMPRTADEAGQGPAVDRRDDGRLHDQANRRH